MISELLHRTKTGAAAHGALQTRVQDFGGLEDLLLEVLVVGLQRFGPRGMSAANVTYLRSALSRGAAAPSRHRRDASPTPARVRRDPGRRYVTSSASHASKKNVVTG